MIVGQNLFTKWGVMKLFMVKKILLSFITKLNTDQVHLLNVLKCVTGRGHLSRTTKVSH